jgi:hypothetical protein
LPLSLLFRPLWHNGPLSRAPLMEGAQLLGDFGPALPRLPEPSYLATRANKKALVSFLQGQELCELLRCHRCLVLLYPLMKRHHASAVDAGLRPRLLACAFAPALKGPSSGSLPARLPPSPALYRRASQALPSHRFGGYFSGVERLVSRADLEIVTSGGICGGNTPSDTVEGARRKQAPRLDAAAWQRRSRRANRVLQKRR